MRMTENEYNAIGFKERREVTFGQYIDFIAQVREENENIAGNIVLMTLNLRTNDYRPLIKASISRNEQHSIQLPEYVYGDQSLENIFEIQDFQNHPQTTLPGYLRNRGLEIDRLVSIGNFAVKCYASLLGALLSQLAFKNLISINDSRLMNLLNFKIFFSENRRPLDPNFLFQFIDLNPSARFLNAIKTRLESSVYRRPLAKSIIESFLCDRRSPNQQNMLAFKGLYIDECRFMGYGVIQRFMTIFGRLNSALNRSNASEALEEFRNNPRFYSADEYERIIQILQMLSSEENELDQKMRLQLIGMLSENIGLDYGANRFPGFSSFLLSIQ